MSSFANLKRQSSNLEKLAKAVEAINSNEISSKDEKFWRCETDKAGNGQATFRFLPAPDSDGEDSLPWVKIFSHGFQGPGGWLIDNCLTTKNEQCPVCESNGVLWNSGIEANKTIARERKRKLNYVSNIYIISDPKHPENEGKVKLFRFGKKIFDKINEAMNPQFDDEKPLNPFDMWKGANFKLKIRKVEGYQNYDKSEFDSPSVLGGLDDDALEEIWKSETSLKELTDDKEFKSYDDLKKRLDKVLGGDKPKTTVETIKAAEKAKPSKKVEEELISELEDDDLKYFENLAAED